jgi:hypothetical protein
MRWWVPRYSCGCMYVYPATLHLVSETDPTTLLLSVIAGSAPQTIEYQNGTRFTDYRSWLTSLGVPEGASKHLQLSSGGGH